MKVYLSPQVSDDRIDYKFIGEKVIVTVGGISEEFDFTGVPNGKLEMFDEETGVSLLENSLPVNPILSAEKKEGVLYLELLNWISKNATKQERFPEWVDVTSYGLTKTVKYRDINGNTIVPEDWSDF